jgi:hypothetical protein
MTEQNGTSRAPARERLSASDAEGVLRTVVLASMVVVVTVIALLSITFGDSSPSSQPTPRPATAKPSAAIIEAYRSARIIDATGSRLAVPHVVDNTVIELGRVGWLTYMKNTLLVEVKRLDGASGYGWACPDGLSLIHEGTTVHLPFRGLVWRDGIRVLVFGQGLDSSSMESFEADRGTRLATSLLLPKETNLRLDIEFGDEVIENN